MNARLRLIFIFTAKVVLIAPFVWLLWWWILPHYAWSIGQIGGTIIIYLGRMPIEAMRIESNEALILNANTILIFTYNQLEYPFDVTSLVSNIPPFLILVGATPSIRFRRAIRACFIGLPIIFAMHIGYVAATFIFRDDIRNAPEIPTAIGYISVGLPFLLWILLVHWESISTYLARPSEENN